MLNTLVSSALASVQPSREQECTPMSIKTRLLGKRGGSVFFFQLHFFVHGKSQIGKISLKPQSLNTEKVNILKQSISYPLTVSLFCLIWERVGCVLCEYDQQRAGFTAEMPNFRVV